MIPKSFEEDLNRVSRHLEGGKLQDAKNTLGLITQSILARDGVLTSEYRVQLLGLAQEIRALSLVERSFSKAPKKSKSWLEWAQASYAQEQDRSLQKIEQLLG